MKSQWSNTISQFFSTVYSMHEMGKFDLPAEIDYVLGKTQRTELGFVGFSMGSSMFWIMMSQRPEYNAKVKLMTALAPVIYINNMKGFPKILLAPFAKDLKVRRHRPTWVTLWTNGVGLFLFVAHCAEADGFPLPRRVPATLASPDLQFPRDKALFQSVYCRSLLCQH